MGQVAIRNEYVDYLISILGHISATDLSAVLQGGYSHDQISRMLCGEYVDDKTLYLKGKRLIKAKGGIEAWSPFPLIIPFRKNPTAR